MRNFTSVDFPTPDFPMMTVKSSGKISKFSFLKRGFVCSGYPRVSSVIVIKGTLFSLISEIFKNKIFFIVYVENKKIAIKICL